METAEQETEIQYDPIYDAASFSFTFDRDTELTGNMKLRLWVSASRSGLPFPNGFTSSSSLNRWC